MSRRRSRYDDGFKASVVRYHNSGDTLRQKLSQQELRDMFAAMSVNQRPGKNELSTVHEGSEDYVVDDKRYATLTRDNIERFNEEVDEDDPRFRKSVYLRRYAESDSDDGFDETFDVKVKQRAAPPEDPVRGGGSRTSIPNPFVMPVSNNTIKGKSQVARSESLHSLSSSSSFGHSGPKSTTSFTESDSERSDYGDDFDDNGVNFGKSELVKRLEQRQHEAEVKEKTVGRNRTIKAVKPTYRERTATIMDEFEDFEELDSGKLRRFKIVNDTLDRKRSMPVLLRSRSSKASITVSPKKSIRKYSSTLDLPASQPKNQPVSMSLSLKARPYYNDNIDDIDEFDEVDDDLTISLSDYKKLKRKSMRRIDLAKYAEEPHTTRNQRTHTDYQAHGNTARLSKEGKLKVIRSMGSHRTKQVLPGHIYGQIVYDPDQMKWCGNEEDLARFESTSRPSLIRKSTSQRKLDKPTQPEVVGNMVYDTKKLRWVSVTGQYEDDPFEGMEDTVTSLSGFTKRVNKRVPTSRMSSSTSTSSLSNYLAQPQNDTDYFNVSADLCKMWKSEETRWLRKVGNWFPVQDDDLAFCYELKSFLNSQ